MIWNSIFIKYIFLDQFKMLPKIFSSLIFNSFNKIDNMVKLSQQVSGLWQCQILLLQTNHFHFEIQSEYDIYRKYLTASIFALSCNTLIWHSSHSHKVLAVDLKLKLNTSKSFHKLSLNNFNIHKSEKELGTYV